MVPPRCPMPRTDSLVSGMTSSSPSSPAKPRFKPAVTQRSAPKEALSAHPPPAPPGKPPKHLFLPGHAGAEGAHLLLRLCNTLPPPIEPVAGLAHLLRHLRIRHWAATPRQGD